MSSILFSSVAWDTTAQDYDIFSENITTKFAEDIYWKVLSQYEIQSDKKISMLDVAAGTGALSILASKELGDKGTILATDFSSGMISIIKQKILEKNLKNISAQVEDATQLSLPNEHFDLIFCLFGIFLIPAPIQALQEMYRVLKPKGVIGITLWTTVSPFTAIVGKAISQLEKLDNHAPLVPPYNPAQLENDLKSVGFINIQVTEKCHRVTFDRSDFFKAMESNPGMLAAKKNLKNTDEFNMKFRQAVNEMYPNDPVQLEIPAFIITASK